LGFRSILVLSGAEFTPDIHTDKPDDHMGDLIDAHLPRPKESASQATVDCLIRIIRQSHAILESHGINASLVNAGNKPANAVWPWNGGRIRPVRSLADRYDGATGAVISAVDVVTGLGKILGMDVIPVEGATGYIDTNWEGKADAAVEALKTHDFVYLHVEGIDEVSHEQNLEKKLKGIEMFDARCMSRVMEKIGDNVRMAVLPDHPVPISIGKHTRTPVPVSVYMPGITPDAITVYNEVTAPGGALGAMQKDDLMNMLLG
jgi:2,3-bisphosphoglycerate-independent phosphoglycerate mutase